MKKKVIIFGILFILAASLAFLPRRPLSSREKIIFQVKSGEGTAEIAKNLEKEGLIAWAPYFRAYALLSGNQGKLQAGTYLLYPSKMDIPEIVEKFASGDIAKEKITFPEGSTSEQIYQKLASITEVQLEDLKLSEGYLFPDTYEINYGMTSEGVVAMMRNNFASKIDITLSVDIQNRHKTLGDVVIMASLIEREVRTKEDREMVSGILWKRLRAGMPLQVDVEMWTYKNPGLPPAPIANPGLDSIKTAIYPKENPYFYYLSTPAGETIFSRTLEEHNIARAKYLK